MLSFAAFMLANYESFSFDKSTIKKLYFEERDRSLIVDETQNNTETGRKESVARRASSINITTDQAEMLH